MMSMNRIRTLLQVGLVLLGVLILAVGISTAVTLGSVGTQEEKIESAETELAKAQKAIDDNPQIVIVSAEENAGEVSLQDLNDYINQAARESRRIIVDIKSNSSANSWTAELIGPPYTAKDIMAFIMKVEEISYPAKASRWTMRRDETTSLWMNVRIIFTLPKKPKDGK